MDIPIPTTPDDSSSKRLMDRMLAAVGELDDHYKQMIHSDLFAGEWGQVGTSALCFALANNIPLDRQLVDDAIKMWINDMGEYLARQFSRIPDRELIDIIPITGGNSALLALESAAENQGDNWEKWYAEHGDNWVHSHLEDAHKRLHTPGYKIGDIVEP